MHMCFICCFASVIHWVTKRIALKRKAWHFHQAQFPFLSSFSWQVVSRIIMKIAFWKCQQNSNCTYEMGLHVLKQTYWGHVFSEKRIQFRNDENTPQIAKFTGPTWSQSGSCRPPDEPHVGPMNLAIGVRVMQILITQFSCVVRVSMKVGQE